MKDVLFFVALLVSIAASASGLDILRLHHV